MLSIFQIPLFQVFIELNSEVVDESRLLKTVLRTEQLLLDSDRHSTNIASIIIWTNCKLTGNLSSILYFCNETKWRDPRDGYLTDEVDTNINTNRKLREVLLMEIGKWKGRKVVLKLNNEI